MTKNCPRCHTSSLLPNEYEGVTIDQCNNCQGIWLDEDELLIIIEEREKTFSRQFSAEVLKRQKAGIPKEEIETKLPCAICGKAMTPNNYNYNSGVIIDFCPDNHGVWLDHLELEKVQAHKEAWQDNKESLSGEKLVHAMSEVNKLDDQFIQSYSEKSILGKIYKYLRSL